MELAEQFRGCLLGCALGDALGVTVEGLSPANLRAKFGRLADLLGGGREGLRPGQNSARIELMRCVLEAYNVRGNFDPQDVSERLVEFSLLPRSIPDPLTRLALRYLAEGWQFERAAQLAQAQASPQQRLSCACLPRCLPPGLLHYHDDLHLIGQSRVLCGITHQAELCRISAVAMNLALQHMLLVGTDGLLEELLVWLAPRSRQLHDSLSLVPSLRPDRLDTGGSVTGCLQAALWAALYPTSFEEGLLLLVNLGGDGPGVCCIAGALLGARFGEQGLPQQWLAELEQRSELARMAQRIFSLSQQASLPLSHEEQLAA